MHSENINELAAALAKAQGALGELQRTLTAKIPTKTGGAYSYSYAPLDACYDACRKPLAENGLSVVQTFTRDPMSIETTLCHSSGQWIKSVLPLAPHSDTEQALGSAITYMRRYALMAIVGLAADTDDDGAAATQATANKPKAAAASPKSSGPVRHPTENQLKRLHAIAKSHGWDETAIHAYTLKEWGVAHTKTLSIEQYNLLCGDAEKGIVGILESPPPDQPDDQQRYDERATVAIAKATDWVTFKAFVTKMAHGYVTAGLDFKAAGALASEKMMFLINQAAINGDDPDSLRTHVDSWAHFSSDQRQQLRTTLDAMANARQPGDEPADGIPY